jgi:hypothetical protein
MPDFPAIDPQGHNTVTSKIGFRLLLSVQLSGTRFLGLLALTPCLFPRSNVLRSPAQCFTILLMYLRKSKNIRPIKKKKKKKKKRRGGFPPRHSDPHVVLLTIPLR